MALLSLLLITLGGLLFFHRRLLRYFRFFQQEEYDSVRFMAWLRANRALDRRGSAVALVAGGLSLWVRSDWASVLALAGALALVILAVREEDPRKTGKIRLNLTPRARRIQRVAFLLYGAALLPAALLCHWLLGVRAPVGLWAIHLVLVQAPPLTLMGAAALLAPGEKRRQEAFRQDARRILTELAPFVIGITGSYGKTSTKGILRELLQQGLGPTFCPPRSINTVMGITRQIRENLRREHRWAVIEMGAYRRGSIQRLCALTPPRAAIVTTVGIMHLERFGDPEDVYQAKSELPQALPPEGILVLNGDNPGTRRMAREHPKGTTLLFGLDPALGDLDCWISDARTTPDGTVFSLHWRGATYPVTTRLLGRAALANLLAAFTMACALGAEPRYLVAVMANLEPESNRLELVREGEHRVLRDGYNSNPAGFEAALEVLAELPANRRILVTPGMIELGDRQAEENRRMAGLAAQVCDRILLVGETNRAAWLEGLDQAGYPEDQRLVLDHRDEALHRVGGEARPEDLILIENDLPDVYEARPSF